MLITRVTLIHKFEGFSRIIMKYPTFPSFPPYCPFDIGITEYLHCVRVITFVPLQDLAFEKVSVHFVRFTFFHINAPISIFPIDFILIQWRIIVHCFIIVCNPINASESSVAGVRFLHQFCGRAEFFSLLVQFCNGDVISDWRGDECFNMLFPFFFPS